MKANIKQILEDYKAKMRLREEGDEAYLMLPFFQRYETDSIMLKFYTEGEDLYLSDCGCTVDYLFGRNINIEDYRDSLERIKKRFFLSERNGNEFIMCFPSDSTLSVEMFVGFFIQAVSVIGNIDFCG